MKLTSRQAGKIKRIRKQRGMDIMESHVPDKARETFRRKPYAICSKGDKYSNRKENICF